MEFCFSTDSRPYGNHSSETMLCRRHTVKKLVPESCLVPETCMSVSQSGTSSFWYKFLACNWTQFYASTETVRHVTRTEQRNWPARTSCFCARNCDELASNFSRKFLVQISRAWCVAGFRRNRLLFAVCEVTVDDVADDVVDADVGSGGGDVVTLGGATTATTRSVTTAESEPNSLEACSV